ncbi:hypothetical protein Hanom_Chr02g00142001 [Helianthus anomalus]
MVKGWVKGVVDLFAKRCRWCPVVPRGARVVPVVPRSAGGRLKCGFGFGAFFFGPCS